MGRTSTTGGCAQSYELWPETPLFNRTRVLSWETSARGKVERVYRPVEVEQPGDVGSEETAGFLRAVLDATNLDIGAAYQAKRAGRRREVTVHRGMLRLTEEALAELRGHIDRLAAPRADDETEGTWARLVVALVGG